jgi:hypothetical protein
LSISPGNGRTIAQERGEKWTGAAGSQPTILKSDRLLGITDNGLASGQSGQLDNEPWAINRGYTLMKIFKYPHRPA